jgi:hypothetical protein
MLVIVSPTQALQSLGKAEAKRDLNLKVGKADPPGVKTRKAARVATHRSAAKAVAGKADRALILILIPMSAIPCALMENSAVVALVSRSTATSIAARAARIVAHWARLAAVLQTATGGSIAVRPRWPCVQ